MPDPGGEDVLAFAGGVELTGSADDDNAVPWAGSAGSVPASVEGGWSSRWYADGGSWRQGRRRLTVAGQRVYIQFDWDGAAGQGLIEARRDGPDRLVGRYLNLGAPEITRPWVGLVVDTTRIDGAHPGGRIDFRR